MTLAAQPSAPTPARSNKTNELEERLLRMRAAHRREGAPEYEARIDALARIESLLRKHKDAFAAAVSADFGNRSKHETMGAELFTSISNAQYARKHLKTWMAPERRSVAAAFLPGRAEVIAQPLGVVGVISPWNYPIFLAFSPLVYAIAAGNRVMLKPSELTPRTSELLRSVLAESFDEDEVSVVLGGPDVGETFSRLPFDHLLFTGSTRLGRLVAKTAGENLVPVTLELGGKSPTIVAEDYDIGAAATKVMAGKLLNAGQTCVAPDYALVPEGKLGAFVDACVAAAKSLYPTLLNNPDYTSIVNDRHYARLSAYVEEARAEGVRIVEINPANEPLPTSSRKLAPTLLVSPPERLAVMQDEIFGPLMPVLPYRNLGEAIDYINDHPRPLALYCFSHQKPTVDRVLRETVSGGVTINDTLLHVGQDDMPFGGVGPSGMGHYHGREGFETFSKKKPIFYQARVSGTSALFPPYGKLADTLFKILIG